MKYIWEVVEECKNENGVPMCWALEINNCRYGKFVWITENRESYSVEVMPRNGVVELVRCKSLTSAKRWVAMNLY